MAGQVRCMSSSLVTWVWSPDWEGGQKEGTSAYTLFSDLCVMWAVFLYVYAYTKSVPKIKKKEFQKMFSFLKCFSRKKKTPHG